MKYPDIHIAVGPEAVDRVLAEPKQQDLRIQYRQTLETLTKAELIESLVKDEMFDSVLAERDAATNELATSKAKYLTGIAKMTVRAQRQNCLHINLELKVNELEAEVERLLSMVNDALAGRGEWFNKYKVLLAELELERRKDHAHNSYVKGFEDGEKSLNAKNVKLREALEAAPKRLEIADSTKIVFSRAEYLEWYELRSAALDKEGVEHE